MSEVYRAEDIKNGTHVALKFMKERVTSSFIEDKIRFRNEVAVVSKLEHSNIVKVYGIGEFKNSYYLAMELLQGKNLSQLLKSGRQFSIGDSLHIVKQLTEALVYVHNQGVIHRDIKPGNIFIENDGLSLKLLDFGVALIMELKELKDEDEIAGTFGFMSPEGTGILNKRVDERSDLYSLGILFYRLLTGDLPFKADTIGKMVHQQVALVPLRPSAINTNISPVLDDIVLKLINKEPDLRYQSAKGFLYDIVKYASGNTNFFIGEKDQKIKLTYQTKLIGREDELSEIKRLFHMANNGKGSICLIRGEAGSGKSRLIEEIRCYVTEHDALYVNARCLNQENKIPYQPFKVIVDFYINYLDSIGKSKRNVEVARIQSILGDLTEILIRFNPNMKKIIGSTKKLVPLDSERENQRFLMVLSDFFCNLSENGKPCIMVIDDLHWIDEGSYNLLTEITRKISNSKILFIGSFRSNEIGEEHYINKLVKVIENKKSILKEIELTTLDHDKLKQFIAKILGDKPEYFHDLATFILEKTNGNPLFSLNVIRELVEENALSWNNGQWEKNWAIIKNVSISKNMVDIILKRISNLPEQLGEILGICAVIGREIKNSVLYQLVKFDKSTIISNIDKAIALQFLEKCNEKGRLIFTHDRIRDVFYQALGPEKKCGIHKAIVATLENTNKDDLEEEIFTLAYHSVESGDDELILKYTILAAEQARHSYANEEALKYYKLGIQKLEEKGMRTTEEWIKAYEGFMDVCLTIGNNDEVIQIAMELIKYKSDPLQKSLLFKKVGTAYFKMGNWACCESNLQKGLRLLGVNIPMNKVDVVVSLLKESAIHLMHSSLSKVISVAKRSQTAREEYKEIVGFYLTLNWMYILSDLNKFVCNVLKSINTAESSIGKSKELGLSYAIYGSLCMVIPFFKRAKKYYESALEIRKELGDEWGIAQCFQWLGFNYLWQGDYESSINCFKQSIEKFTRIGDLWEIGISLTGLGNAYHYTGYFDKGIECYSRNLENSLKINDYYGTGASYANIANCNREKGNYEESEKMFLGAINLSKEKKILFVSCFSSSFYGYLELERGHYDQAIENLVYAKKVYEKNKFIKEYSVDLYAYLAESYIENYKAHYITTDIKKRAQEIQKIRASCKEAYRKTRRWVNHHGISLRALAKYYELIGNSKKAESLFVRTILHFKHINRKYELAKSYVDYGYFLTSCGKTELSKKCWEEALEIFTEIDSEAFKKKCTQVLNINEENDNSEKKTVTKQERLNLDRRATAVISTGLFLSSILDLDQLVEKILDAAIEMTGAERGALLLYSEVDSTKLEQKLFRNVLNQNENNSIVISSRSIVECVVVSKAPLIIDDAAADENFKNQDSVILNNLKSIICAPIMLRGEVLGVIYLDNRMVSGLFKNEDLETLMLLANQAGVSLENAKLYKNALNDGLTGIYNRAFFDNTLMKYVATSQRHKKALSLLIIDVDFFKKINDMYGHQAGDFVLVSIARILNKNIREGDILCRYGGEEYVIILPETDAEGAMIIADRLRKLIEHNEFIYENVEGKKNLQLTISIGVAQLSEAMERIQLLGCADKALYKAKENGRNMSCLYVG